MDEQIKVTRQQIYSLRKVLLADQDTADGKSMLARMSTQELIDYLIDLHIAASVNPAGQDLPAEVDNSVRLSRPENNTLSFGLSRFAFCD